MKEVKGACETCRESIESYVSGELSELHARDVAFHLAECDECAAYHTTQRDLIQSLRDVPSGVEPVRPVSVAAQRRPQSRALGWWQTAAGVAAGLALFAISALTIPAFASQIPGLPVSAELERLQTERDRLEAEAKSLGERVEQLEIEVKQIGGENVPVVDTAPDAVAPEVNDAVQRLAMDFIRAQYRGDKAALKALSTKRLDAQIDKNPGEYLKKPGDVVFAQMTTVGKTDDGTLLVFVRLSDAEFSDSTYQENFEIKLEGGNYLVDSVGMDA
jgi:hypothetical protein